MNNSLIFFPTANPILFSCFVHRFGISVRFVKGFMMFFEYSGDLFIDSVGFWLLKIGVFIKDSNVHVIKRLLAFSE